MNVTVKKLGNSKVELNIAAGKDVVRQKYDAVYAQISKEAKIPGFRPGNAPMEIIKKRFSDAAKQEVIRGLAEDLCAQAIKQENIFAISSPHISEVNLSEGNFSFKATVEVKPEVAVKKYKGIKIKRQKAEVSEEKVKEALENVKKERGAEEVNDNFAKSLGYPSLADLQEFIKNQLFVANSENARRKYEAEVASYLIANSQLEVPRSLIEREIEERWQALEYQLLRQGLNKDKIEEKKKELDKPLKDAAERDLKAYFILDKIAALENIAIDEKHGTQKVMDFLLKEAEWTE